LLIPNLGDLEGKERRGNVSKITLQYTIDKIITNYVLKSKTALIKILNINYLF
jgi:hypothetical protein